MIKCPFIGEPTHIITGNCEICEVRARAEAELLLKYIDHHANNRRLDREEDDARFREIKILYFTCVLSLCVGISLWMIATW